jgi:hypothetical protein
MTVSLSKSTKIPPYLPDRNNYQATHPNLVHVEFGKEGEEFNSCLKTDRVRFPLLSFLPNPYSQNVLSELFSTYTLESWARDRSKMLSPTLRSSLISIHAGFQSWRNSLYNL